MTVSHGHEFVVKFVVHSVAHVPCVRLKLAGESHTHGVASRNDDKSVDASETDRCR